MDAWIKIFVVLLLISALSLVVGYILIQPFVSLIVVAVLLVLLVLTFEPATGKAMAQIIVPIILILFVMQIFLTPGLIVDLPMLIITGVVLYLLFAIFTGGGGFVEGGFIDAKVSCKLFPLYGLAILISVFADPTHVTTVYIMVGTIFSLMLLYFAFLRDYGKWPEYSYGKYNEVVALTNIDPKGKVKAGAEIWWAKAVGDPVGAGEEVRVIGVSGITMLVEKLKSTGASFEEPTT